MFDVKLKSGFEFRRNMQTPRRAHNAQFVRPYVIQRRVRVGM